MLPYAVSSRIVISGSHFEHYEYKKPFWVGFPVGKRFVVSRASQVAIREDNVQRTRKKLRRLINSNPDFKTFITLTFADNVNSLELANPIFKRFIDRLRRRYSDLKYVAVPEFQKRGAVHYHLLTNIDFIENKILAGLWGQGFVKINEIGHIGNIGAYVSKYLGKANFDPRYFKKQKYFASQNLQKPLVVDNLDMTIYLNSVPEKNVHFSAKYEYCAKWLGDVIYKYYILYNIKVGGNNRIKIKLKGKQCYQLKVNLSRNKPDLIQKKTEQLRLFGRSLSMTDI